MQLPGPTVLSVLRSPALLPQAKTQQCTREAHLTAPGALRPPHPCWPFPWCARHCPEPLSHSASSSLSSLPTSQLMPLPFPMSIRCAAWMLPASKWSHRAGPGKQTPCWDTLWGCSSSCLKQASQALCQHNHTETCQPPSSQRLQIPWQPAPFPPGFCRRARCFSWEDSLQHPSACWQGSSVQGKPLPTQGAQGKPGGEGATSQRGAEIAAVDG